MDYLARAVELADQSFDSGEFPAGAVLVTKSGNVYESKPSLPHNHGETMVIDMAIEVEGAPLAGATLYTSMQPCLMCSSKSYWAGIEKIEFVIPKTQVNAEYAYEDSTDTQALVKGFWKSISMTHRPEHLEKALSSYQEWVQKIEA